MHDSLLYRQTARPLARLVVPALVFAALVVGLVWGAGSVPLFDLDEGAFTEATREMFERGDFLATYVNGVPRYDKPILIYWLQAASVSLLGVNEIGFRLPSILAAFLWLSAIYAFGRPRLGSTAALIAALIASTTFDVQLIAHAATADALLNLLLAAAMFDIYRYFESGDAGARNRAFAWIGLGVLTKGPVAIAIPFLVSAIFAVTQGAGRRWFAAVTHPGAWLLFLVIVLPWPVAQILRDGPGFLSAFLLEHNVTRFLATREGHGGTLFYYFAAVPVILLPYSVLFLRLFARLLPSLHDPMTRFLWLWFAVVFIFFSFSATQLPHYLLYGAPPLFLLMAREAEGAASAWSVLAPTLVVLMLLVFLPELVDYGARRSGDPYVQAMLARGHEVFDLRYRIGVVVAGALALGLAFVRALAPWQRLLAIGIVHAWTVAQLLLPAVGALKQQPVREAARVARALNVPVVMWPANRPSFSVYLGRVTPRRPPRAGEIVFTEAGQLARLGRYELLYERGGVALARMIEP
ncbi:MAG: ArnT family glycosyltransferase [Sulfurifustaceae bacterium]